ncbi:MAG: pilus assembly protein [Planctomycetaceae bacterium]|jgi:Flp pilus assembly protein TadG|nr:pilus assembly protein [Planctomycetaceae bacterium]MBT6156296.1 pilus assembly protein [Planctomycetaceae bacterium]MBT6483483.1 pilus assembly protein [Planctomycetaceae bacterium]MBT6494706.1 pilus assembly protein [Planctomycetaceae bacterium]
MKRIVKNHRRRGAAIVELAIALPVLLAVVFGIIEFGRALSASQVMTSAARIGSRNAILGNATNPRVELAVKKFCQSSLNVNPGDVFVSITVTPAIPGQNRGDDVANAEEGDLCAITVEIPFDKLSYTTGQFLNGKNLVARCTMQK